MLIDEFYAMLLKKKGPASLVVGGATGVELGAEGESKCVEPLSEMANIGGSTTTLVGKDRDKKGHRDAHSSRHHKKPQDGTIQTDGEIVISSSGTDADRSLQV